ncbi:STAS domain-containing protein [uncultured Desulfovibrio sp.]|uniref:STAS domain-containing protein n=1 Tax=Candidatus Desulfovibrio intestinavium TaxID=2838534 RepID=A0A9D2HN91_9BACT|nr:STAS domain-containing protein [uncultured Desulfovibrio sp.]HJA79322.1 STAS domain-containing protein [Candidatus Desulfovibrio intestinavium]
MFTLDTESHNKTIIVRYQGTLLLQDAIALRDELEKLLLADNVAQVVIDLSEVHEVDSSGIGALVSADTLGRSRGRGLILLSPSQQVEQILKDVDIEGFLPSLANEHELESQLPDVLE